MILNIAVNCDFVVIYFQIYIGVSISTEESAPFVRIDLRDNIFRVGTQVSIFFTHFIKVYILQYSLV